MCEYDLYNRPTWYNDLVIARAIDKQLLFWNTSVLKYLQKKSPDRTWPAQITVIGFVTDQPLSEMYFASTIDGHGSSDPLRRGGMP